jgi:hypothetical protein
MRLRVRMGLGILDQGRTQYEPRGGLVVELLFESAVHLLFPGRRIKIGKENKSDFFLI